jgi:hypothetical protein
MDRGEKYSGSDPSPVLLVEPMEPPFIIIINGTSKDEFLLNLTQYLAIDTTDKSSLMRNVMIYPIGSW